MSNICSNDPSGSERRRYPGALIDSPLRVEFGRDVSAPDDVHGAARCLQLSQQITPRLLAGADHDVTDVEQARSLVLVTEADVQTLFVDALVVDTVDHLDAAGLEGGTMHPPRGLAEPGSDP